MYSDSGSKAGKFDVVTLSRGRTGAVPEPIPPAVARTADLVSQAANTIDELVTYGQNISDVSERGILHYRQLASAAQERVEALQKQLTALGADYEALAVSSKERIQLLERILQEQSAELEKLRAIMWPSLKT